MTDPIDTDVLDILSKHTDMGDEKVTPDTSLQSIGVDSLLMVEIMYDLEERFDISIPDPDFIGDQNPQFETAADVVRVVKELIEEQRNTL